MANTSTELVKSYYGADKLSESNIDDGFIGTAISDSIMKANADGVPDNFKEYAQRLYACHLISKRITNDATDNGNVVMEKVAALQTQYKNYDGSNKYDDPFEAEYQKLLDSLGLGYTTAKFM